MALEDISQSVQWFDNMNIIITNFASYNFLFTEGDSLREAMMPWIKDEHLQVKPYVNILDLLSGADLGKDDFESLGLPGNKVYKFDLDQLYKVAPAGFDVLNLNQDWILDYNNANSFKFCPYCYSFKSGTRRFYVLNLEGNDLILSNYRGSWSILPLRYNADRFSNYVPIRNVLPPPNGKEGN